MNFIIFSLGTGLFFALAIFFRKNAGFNLSPTTAYFIETCVQFAIMLAVFLILSPQSEKVFDFKNKGLSYAALAGVMIVIAILLNYWALKTGGVARTIGITSPAQIIFGTLLGVLLLGESFTTRQILGTILSILGILLIVFK